MRVFKILQSNQYSLFLQICVAVDRLAALIKSIDQLSDSPIDRVHRHLAQPSTAACFGPLGNMELLQKKILSDCRLLLFPQILSFSSRLSTLEQKEIFRPVRYSPNVYSDPQVFLSSFFSIFLFLFTKQCMCFA